ncbi:MAG: pyrroline-5-carboxylate reductase, partial [Actinobacteria bacterium]|nr:pyrroline-5-carboxylate reductase [Actinomycetota bacterium]
AALLADGTDPADLQARVTSPGGTTAAGVAALDERGAADAIAAAVRAAAARAAEL